MNKGPNATIHLVRWQNHAGTTVSWTTVQREKSSHAYKLSSNVQTACSTDSLNNCPKHSILRFSSFALKIYLWLKMCQHKLPCSIVYAHCLLPGRAFASLYVLLILEKEAEIGGRYIIWGSSAGRRFSSNMIPYLLLLKKWQNLQSSSAENYRWPFKGQSANHSCSRWLLLCHLFILYGEI